MESIEVLMPVLRSFQSLNEGTRRNLAEQQLGQLVSRCSLECINRVLEMSRQRSMALIGYGPFFTALVNRIKSDSSDSNLTQAIIGEAPLEQRMSIGTALAQMIRSNDPRLYAPALQAVQKEHGKLAGEALDAVCQAHQNPL